MSNNQYNSANYITPVGYDPNPNKSAKSNGKLKFIIIGIVAMVIVAALIALSIIFAGGGSQSALTPGREETPTLKIYANLPDEIPISDIEKTVKNIDANAEVVMNDDYGIIKISGTEHEFISFNFNTTTTETDSTDVDDAEDELMTEDEPFEDEWEGTYEAHQPNTAYDFIYTYEYPEYDYALWISRVYDGSFASYQYSDGTDIFDLSSKQEAIDAYLAPVAK